MAGTTAWILGDQLSAHGRALEGADRVLLVESRAALRARRFHRQKLHLILVAMRTFADWASDRRRIVMEDFYRLQRRRLNLLMDGEQPAGGQWNLDAENRRRADASVAPPRPYQPREGDHDAAVRRELDDAGYPTWGDDGPRRWPASRAQARRALRRFIDERLTEFGAYQDAMLDGRRTMWHSLLSSSLNLGLLDPLECARAAEMAYRDGSAPLNSVEGFVRQLIGWREYVWCMYWYAQATWAGVEPRRSVC